MKKIFQVILPLFLLVPLASSAQMMGGSYNTQDDHTAREEAEGKAIWQALQAKEKSCTDLDDEDFGVLGEYFMGQMMGEAHSAMNEMMTRMMGEEGEEAMHVVMGKRLSGCDTDAAFPAGGYGFMPMMNMFAPYGSGGSRFGWGGMMGTGGGSPFAFGWFGFIVMILWWALIIAAIIFFIKWLARQLRSEGGGKTALDILKERYAKGEIDKKEFEEKKQDLSR